MIHDSRPWPSSARSKRQGQGNFESTEAGGLYSKLLNRARYTPQALTSPKLPAAAEGVVPRAPEFPEYPRLVSYLAKRGVQVERDDHARATRLLAGGHRLAHAPENLASHRGRLRIKLGCFGPVWFT